jgi:hypothetical protein
MVSTTWYSDPWQEKTDFLKVSAVLGGGGIWHVPFAIDPGKGPSSLTHLRSELIGIAFCQDELCENTRQVTGHGYKSAYNELHRRLIQGLIPHLVVTLVWKH